MILGFKDQFVQKILDGTKIHTIRTDINNRWEKDKPIHFATKVRTPEYNQFKKGECTGTQIINLYPITQTILFYDNSVNSWVSLNKNEISGLAKHDGFDTVKDFWKFFKTELAGKIIHWTDFKY